MCLVRAKRFTHLLVPISVESDEFIQIGSYLRTGRLIDVDVRDRKIISVGSQPQEVFLQLKTLGRVAVLCKDVMLVQ